MALHPLADRFASVAEEYELGRPEYPPGVVGALAAELGLRPGATVLDLAAGTGKLSRALLAAGLDVVAVEPQQALRERLAASVGAERVREGLAEAIPLADGSVAAVTVADAIHWFDHAPALAEIARVLDGRREPRRADDDARLERGLLGRGGGRPARRAASRPPAFRGTAVAAAAARQRPFRGAPRAAHHLVAGGHPERMVAHVGSMSWIAALEEPERAATLSRGRADRERDHPELMPAHVLIGLAALKR